MAVAVVSTAALASAAQAAPVPSSPGAVWCETVTPIEWTTTSTLSPGSGDLVREKDITFDGDVAVDGWTSNHTPGIDGWSANEVANFRVIVGTLHDLRDLDATVTLVSPGAFTAPSVPVSPAGAATPPAYQVVPLPELAPVVPAADGRSLSWTVSPDGGIPGGSSAQFSTTVPMGAQAGSTDPVGVRLVVTGNLIQRGACPDADGDGYTDIADGSGSVCSVDWTAASTIDRRLTDYANNGYRSGVTPDTGAGYLKLHHWITGPTLMWRVPFSTDHAIEAGATLVLTVGDSWSVPADLAVEDLTGQPWVGSEPQTLFNRFTGIDGYQASPSAPADVRVQGDRIVLTLPAMPADSHMMWQFAGTPKPGYQLRLDGFALDGVLTGTYPATVRQDLGCLNPALTLDKSVSEVTDVNANGLTDAGDELWWAFDLVNTGDAALDDVAVEDAFLAEAGISVTCPVTSLAPGASTTCASDAAYVITADDVAAGEVVNTATANGTVPGLPPVVTPPDSTTTVVVPTPPASTPGGPAEGPTSEGPGAPEPTTPGSTPVASTPPAGPTAGAGSDHLAATGAPAALPLGIAAVLVAAGAGALALNARRRALR